MMYIEFVMQPSYYFCFRAAERVRRNSWSHDARIYANSFKSTLPSLGFRIDPIKQSKKIFPDILICFLLKIPHKYITNATISPLIIEVTIILPKLSIKKVNGNIPVQCKMKTKINVKYQLQSALHRQLYCLLSYDGTGRPLIIGPGIMKARIIWRIMKPQYTRTD